MWKKTISNLIRGFTYSQKKRIVEYRLYVKEHLGPEKRVFKSMNKEPLCNLHCLIGAFVEAISLGVVSCTI